MKKSPSGSLDASYAGILLLNSSSCAIQKLETFRLPCPGCFSAVYVVFLGILVIVHRLWFSRVDSVRLVLIQYVVSLGPGKYVGRHAKGGKTCAVKYVGPTVPN